MSDLDALRREGRGRAAARVHALYFKGALLDDAFPALSAALHTYNAVQRQRDAEAYPGMSTTQPMMREMAMGGSSFTPSSSTQPVHHRRHRHHAV